MGGVVVVNVLELLVFVLLLVEPPPVLLSPVLVPGELVGELLVVHSVAEAVMVTETVCETV